MNCCLRRGPGCVGRPRNPLEPVLSSLPHVVQVPPGACAITDIVNRLIHNQSNRSIEFEAIDWNRLSGRSLLSKWPTPQPTSLYMFQSDRGRGCPQGYVSRLAVCRHWRPHAGRTIAQAAEHIETLSCVRQPVGSLCLHTARPDDRVPRSRARPTIAMRFVSERNAEKTSNWHGNAGKCRERTTLFHSPVAVGWDAEVAIQPVRIL